VIRNDETFEKIEGTEDGVIVHLQSGKKMKAVIIKPMLNMFMRWVM